MKKDTKRIFEIFGLIILMCSVLAGLVILLGYVGYRGDLRECQDYNDYGYFTEIKGNFWTTAFISRSACLIIMEDGTKLPLSDFKTMSIKNAKTR